MKWLTSINSAEKIILKRSDANVVPPIAHGLEAPDFKAVTLDSIQYQMMDMRGTLVLLDFLGHLVWSMYR